VGFKDRVDLLITGNLLSLKHAAAALIDDAGAELAVVIDLPSKLADDNVIHQVQTAFIFCLFEYPSGILYNLLGDPDELAIFALLLGVALPRCHPLDLLHPTPRRACAVSKIIDPLGKNLSETTDEPGDDSHDIPEQSIIGWMVDVGFDNRRINAQSLAVLDSEIDSSFDDQIIDGLKCRGPQLVKSPIESVMLGYALGVKTRELAQCVPVGDPLAQFPIVPVLDSHEDQGPHHLRCGYSATARVGFFQTPIEIFSDPLYDLWMIVQEVGNPLENRVEINSLGEELEIGETDLRVRDSCHFLTS
jgi:hypothetical protein